MTNDSRSHHHPGAQFWVGSVFLERPNTGRHEKAPVRCPCSRLAALCGAQRTLEFVVVGRHAGQSQVLVACREMPEHFPSSR